MPKSTHHLPVLLTPAPVLVTESEEEFNRFFDAVKDELKQRGIVDRLLIKDFGEEAWEIRRYRCAKMSCINSAILPALKNLLRPIIQRQVSERQDAAQGRIRKPPRPLELYVPTEAELQGEWDADLEVSRLANQWFVDEDTKELILKMLADNKLDEYAIETEAMRIAAPDLKMFDRLEESAERRLHKTLRLLGDYRSGLGRQLRAAVERVIDGNVLAVANAAKKSPAAA
jgi:hypothetical protein